MSLKIQTILKQAGSLPSQMLPLGGRTRAEQVGVKARLQINLQHLHFLDRTFDVQQRRTARLENPPACTRTHINSITFIHLYLKIHVAASCTYVFSVNTIRAYFNVRMLPGEFIQIRVKQNTSERKRIRGHKGRMKSFMHYQSYYSQNIYLYLSHLSTPCSYMLGSICISESNRQLTHGVEIFQSAAVAIMKILHFFIFKKCHFTSCVLVILAI